MGPLVFLCCGCSKTALQEWWPMEDPSKEPLHRTPPWGLNPRVAHSVFEFFIFFYQILLNAKRDMALAPDPLTGMEMLLLRLLAFRPVNDDKVLADSSRVAIETRPLSPQSKQELSEAQQEPSQAQKPPVDKSGEEHVTKKSAAVSDRAQANTPLPVDVPQENRSPAEPAGLSEPTGDLPSNDESGAAPFDPVRLRGFFQGLVNDGRRFLAIEKVQHIEDHIPFSAQQGELLCAQFVPQRV